MRICHLEIGNFRKLIAVRVDLADTKTVFVGANNSGKTSAMAVLHRFLVDPRAFTVNDLSLTHWQAINAQGAAWEAALQREEALPEPSLDAWLPQIDIWLEAENNEMHYVQKILPSLDWTSGALGVRLRFEPVDAAKLQQEYVGLRAKASDTLRAAAAAAAARADATPAPAVELWPQSLLDFLSRRLRALFKVKAYVLDPAQLVPPDEDRATMQPLPAGVEPLEGNPLDGLIRIDEISAQRGFGMASSSTRNEGDEESGDNRSGRRLSRQLRSYYDSHLDWTDAPDVSDLKAIEALELARKTFDDRLTESFAKALKELEKLNYPGVSDPRLKIATKLRMQDGLNHASAVMYEVDAEAGVPTHRLPEDSNGLGYQNLVSMVFTLMSCRDAWMREGKAASSPAAATPPAPLHLVLVEEPEAYLHAQVQQVFIRHAYDVLRNLPQLKDSPRFTTQLIVSTHSSHVAEACDFAALRYFRRLLPGAGNAVPTSRVVNLTSVFGKKDDETARFVTRYLKVMHCDLFFADAAVLIEGAAERILVPHFVEERLAFEYLKSAYITWLEIGGSHAHRLRRLIEALGLTTLIIADLDAKDPATDKVVSPERGKGQESRNQTVRTWAPGKHLVDELLDLKEDEKVRVYPRGFSVRAAYQGPVAVKVGDNAGELLADTFEDAVFYSNLDFFKGRKGTGMAGAFRRAVDESKSLADLSMKAQNAINSKEKAEFALDLLYSEDVQSLEPPAYIRDGLLWLIEQLRRKEESLAPKVAVV